MKAYQIAAAFAVGAALHFAFPRAGAGAAAPGQGAGMPHAAVAPTLAVAATLAGTWVERRPTAQGSVYVEEIWSAPQGDNVVGSFRWLGPDGKASMYELLVITQEEDGTYLRLRHFGADLGAWEERDAPKTLRLAEAADGRLVFRAHAHCGDLAGVTYDRSEEDVLAIAVTFAGERSPLEFRLRRAP
jgi:hypothetical protein